MPVGVVLLSIVTTVGFVLYHVNCPMVAAGSAHGGVALNALHTVVLLL
jgi:hypothetical protein